jgi:D-lyxose ketol-isomerase
MKRSEINRYIKDAKDFIRVQRFNLPPFAFWSPEKWKTKGPEYDEIRNNQLGWDLTDFGSTDYEKTGLFLFTIRNGNLKNPTNKKIYAEKLLLGLPGQVTPFHYHKSKMEDIINRGGQGKLCVRLYGSRGPHELDKESPIPVTVDGRNFLVEPGSVLQLSPGESITLFQGIFHEFWADGATLLLGEVSMVNDDFTDNYFLEERGRFPSITEDEPPLHLLIGDYAKAEYRKLS